MAGTPIGQCVQIHIEAQKNSLLPLVFCAIQSHLLHICCTTIFLAHLKRYLLVNTVFIPLDRTVLLHTLGGLVKDAAGVDTKVLDPSECK